MILKLYNRIILPIFLGGRLSISGPTDLASDVTEHSTSLKTIDDCSDDSDHDPLNLLEIFKHPERFLRGPKSLEKKHFTVVGGGISGLNSALLLLQLGHQVRLRFTTTLKSKGA